MATKSASKQLCNRFQCNGKVTSFLIFFVLIYYSLFNQVSISINKFCLMNNLLSILPLLKICYFNVLRHFWLFQFNLNLLCEPDFCFRLVVDLVLFFFSSIFLLQLWFTTLPNPLKSTLFFLVLNFV